VQNQQAKPNAKLLNAAIIAAASNQAKTALHTEPLILFKGFYYQLINQEA